MLTVGTGIGGGLIIDGAALSRLDRRGRGARPYGDPARRAEVPGQLPEPRVRGGARLRNGDRPRGAEAAERAPTRRSGGARGGSSSTAGWSPRRRWRGTSRRRGCVEHVGRRLGVASSGLANIFDPDVIVIGGGARSAGELLLGPAREELATRALPPMNERRWSTAELGADAGMIGAATMALRGAGASSGPLMPGRLTVCPTPIGNLGGSQSSRAPGAGRRRPGRLRGHPPRRAGCSSCSRSSRPQLVSNHEGNEAERAPPDRPADRARREGRADLRRRHARHLRPRLPPDPRPASTATSRSRCCPGPSAVTTALVASGLPASPLAVRGLPAAPRRRARARAALGRDRGRVRVAAAAARLAGGARGAGARPPRRRLPRADQAPRGDRPRHPRRARAGFATRSAARSWSSSAPAEPPRPPTSASPSTRCAAWSAPAPSPRRGRRGRRPHRGTRERPLSTPDGP